MIERARGRPVLLAVQDTTALNLSTHRHLALSRAGRGPRSATAPASQWLSETEWQALWCHTHRSATPPAQPPNTREAVRMIARLGGFLGRKHDGEPGMIVQWRGLQRLHAIATAWEIFTSAARVVGNA